MAAQARMIAAAEGVEHASDFFGGLSARRLWIAMLDFTLRPPSKLARASAAPPVAAEAETFVTFEAAARDGVGAGLSEGGSEAARKRAACSATLSALLDAICTMLRRLDLAATAANAEAEVEADGSAGAPAAAAAAAAPSGDGSRSGGGDGSSGGGGGEGSAAERASDEADATASASLSLEAAAARNPSDVQIFLSLSAFTDVLLREVHPELLLRWGHVLLLELIGRSGRYPHISGFYRLIRIVTTVLDGAGYFPSAGECVAIDAADAMEVDGGGDGDGGGTCKERESCYALLGTFLVQVQQRCRRFQGELLAAALELLLSAPLSFVSLRGFAQLPSLCDAAQLALSMGHTYAPLSAAALDAIERLHGAFPSRLQPHLPALLPRLHSYLTTSSESTGHNGTMRKERDARRHHSASTRAATMNAARSRLRRAQDDLTQQRIVRLLGAVGGDAVSLVHGARAAPTAEGRWEISSRIKVHLPLTHESALDLPIDAVLPRVVELATSSMVYREKAAACELLDAVVKYCIGRQAQRAEEDWTGQYAHLFPAMLTLATDVDAFARSLFEPLTMQTIHWLSASTRKETPASAKMLEAIMGAVADQVHSGRRDFGARCLGEFIRYAIKRKRDDGHAAQPIGPLLSRLYGLAHHPSPMHRLGFAFALNSVEVYRELREDADTLNVHLLELVQHALLALRLAQTDPEALGTCEALGSVLVHLRKMLLRDQILQLLAERNEERPAFKEGLHTFAMWLFEQCMQPRAAARLGAMDLFNALCPKLTKLKQGGGGARGRKSSGTGANGGASGGSAEGSSKEWVHEQFGMRTDALPIVRLFTPISSKPPPNPSVAVGTPPAADAMHLSESAQGLSGGDGLMNSIEGQCAAGAWAALAHNVPLPASTSSASSSLSSASPEVIEMAWLERVQAALDATFWTLRSRHLTTDAVLSSSGSLRRVHATVHALFGYVARRAPTQSSVLMSDAESRRRAHVREALKSAFRLLRKLIAEAPAQPGGMSARLSAFLVPSVDAAPSSAPGATSSLPLSCMHLALLATLRPTRVGFDASELEACGRMRVLACELCGELHARQPEQMVEELRALLQQEDSNLHQRPLVDPRADALETLALLEGYLGLLGCSQPLLLRALPNGCEQPNGAPALVSHLLLQVCAAPLSASPLDMRLYAKALELCLALGIESRHLLERLLDETPATDGRRGGIAAAAPGVATRGELLSGRFRSVLLPQLALAERSSTLAPLLLAAAPTNLSAFSMLLALLEFLDTRRDLPAEPLVRVLEAQLPTLLLQVGWANGRVWTPPADAVGTRVVAGADGALLLQPFLSLFRLLLRLAPHLVLQPSSEPSAPPSPLLGAILQLLKASLTSSEAMSGDWGAPGGAPRSNERHNERLLYEAVKLMPLVLRSLKLPLPPPPSQGQYYATVSGFPNTASEPLATLRRLLQAEVPQSLFDCDEVRRRRVNSVLSPLLDAIAHPEGRAYALAAELLSQPALTEYHLEAISSEHDQANPFADGVRSALCRLVDAACQRGAPKSVYIGTDALRLAAAAAVDAPVTSTTPATELWRCLVVPCLCADAADAHGRPIGRWSERLARVRWVGLPLMHRVPVAELLGSFLAPILPQLRALLNAANPGKPGEPCKATLFRPVCTATLSPERADAAHSDGAALPPAAADAAEIVNAQLARCIVACEVLGGMMGRLGREGKEALQPGGVLSPGAEDLYKGFLIQVLAFLGCKKIELPPALEESPDRPPPALASTPAVGSGSRQRPSAAAVAQTLRRALIAAAYAAFVETVVQTQKESSAIEKTIFKNGLNVWELAVDLKRTYKLTAGTAFETTTDSALLTLQGREPATRQDGARGAGAAYLPSQALLGSSLSQAAHDLGVYDPDPAPAGVPAASVSPRTVTQASQPASQAGEVKLETTSDLGLDDDDSDGRRRKGGGGELSGSGGVVLVQGYELDELSRHPLMGTMLRAISELKLRGLDRPASVGTLCSERCPCGAGQQGPMMPAWMHVLFTQMMKGYVPMETARRELHRSLQSDPAAPHDTFWQAEASFAKTFNVRLIIARLVYNLTRQEKAAAQASAGSDAAAGTPSFEKHARLWARPLLQVVLDSLKDSANATFNYLARDLVVLVAEWQRNENHRASTAGGIPTDLLQSAATLPSVGARVVDPLLDDLLEKLIFYCGHQNTIGNAMSVSELLRENVRVVKLIMELWRDRLHVRLHGLWQLLRYSKIEENSKKRLENQETRFRLCGIHICGALLFNKLSLDDDPNWKPYVKNKENKFAPYVPVKVGEIGLQLVLHTQDERKAQADKQTPTARKDLYKPASAVLGMHLMELHTQAQSSMNALAAQQLEQLLKELTPRLTKLMAKTQDTIKRILTILFELSVYYPKVLLLNTATFGRHVRTLLTEVYGGARVQVLGCLERCVELEVGSATQEERLRVRIQDFVADASQRSHALHSLNAYERLLAHRIAEELGLVSESASHGDGQERFITLYKRGSGSASVRAHVAPPTTRPAEAEAMDVDADGAPSFKVELSTRELQLILQQQQGDVQIAALRLVTALCKARGALVVAPYVTVLNTAFDGHKDKETRSLHLRLLMKIREEPAVQMHSPAMTDAATASLLRGLSDPDEGARCVSCAAQHGGSGGRPVPGCWRCTQGLRAEVVTFWNQSVLTNQLKDRMISCFGELHAPAVESRWLHYCGVLMLQLPLDSPNAGTCTTPPLVDKDGKPIAFTTNTAAVPDANSSSVAMRPWGSLSQSQSSQDDGGLGPLRATQSQRLFTQTQTQGGGTGGVGLPMTYSTQDASGAPMVLWGTATRRVAPPVPLFHPSSASQAPSAAAGGAVASQGDRSQDAFSQPLGSQAPDDVALGKRFKPKLASGSSAEVNLVALRRSRALAATRRSGAAVGAFRTNYRRGELPDVEISPRDMLLPLQALVHHDPLVAKLTFTQLYTTVRQQFSADSKAIEGLHRGVTSLLASRHGGPAFVGCLHELALSEQHELQWLPAELVAESAKASGNLHSGILILEQHLAQSGGAEGGRGHADGGAVEDAENSGGRKAKRSRDVGSTDAGFAGSHEARQREMQVKAQLADLYRAIGDEDVVRGISSEMATSENVRRALAAETRGDASEALKHYEKARAPKDDAMLGAMDGSTGSLSAASGALGALPEWEAKLIERGSLEARSLLGMVDPKAKDALLKLWTHVAQQTTDRMIHTCEPSVAARPGAAAAHAASSDARGPMTFEGSLSEGWVRTWIVASAKADGAQKAIGWGLWPNEPAGAPRPQRDTSRLLEAGHGALLLLDRFAVDDLNAIRALLPRCAHAFVRRWATLHPLAEQARLAELLPLQLLTEAAEVTSLLEEASTLSEDPISGAVGQSAEFTNLLRAWTQRLPSVTHHNTSVWDDLICARSRLLATLHQATQERLKSFQSGRTFVDGPQQATLLKAFERERNRAMLTLYEAAAAATRDQGNFGAAESYIRESGNLRRTLGLTKDDPSFACSLYRLMLQREQARSAEDGGGWSKTLRTVHTDAQRVAALVGTSGPNGTAASPAEVCELRTVQAYVAWELAALPSAGSGSSAELTAGGSTASDLVRSAYDLLKQNAAQAEGLGSTAADLKRHAAMRLELVDLIDKVLTSPRAELSPDALRLHKAELTAVAIEQVVRAMAAGSLAARERLPSALALCRGAPELWAQATELLELPPLWMSLAWAPQMIAMLYEPHGTVVAPLLQKLTAAYPQVIAFDCL